jgi:hypothetical protein
VPPIRRKYRLTVATPTVGTSVAGVAGGELRSSLKAPSSSSASTPRVKSGSTSAAAPDAGLVMTMTLAATTAVHP